MRIKEVRFEKLFSLAKYNNERIGFVAEVEEGENADKVAGELHFKILAIEDCLNAYRRILNRLESFVSQFESKKRDIKRLQKDIVEKKIHIEEVAKRLQKGELDVDEKLRHACDRESYKDMKKRLEEYQAEANKLDGEIQRLVESKEELSSRIKQGNFSVEGIEIPRAPRHYY